MGRRINDIIFFTNVRARLCLRTLKCGCKVGRPVLIPSRMGYRRLVPGKSILSPGQDRRSRANAHHMQKRTYRLLTTIDTPSATRHTKPLTEGRSRDHTQSTTGRELARHLVGVLEQHGTQSSLYCPLDRNGDHVQTHITCKTEPTDYCRRLLLPAPLGTRNH